MSVDINYLKKVYRNSRIRYVIQEVKKVIKGQTEEKIICVKGGKNDIYELIQRLKRMLKLLNGELLFSYQGNKKAVYVFFTSAMPNEIPRKSAVIIVENSGEYAGECEKVEIK